MALSGTAFGSDFSREEAAIRAYVADRTGVAIEDVEILSLGLLEPLNCTESATISASARGSEDFRGHAEFRLAGTDALGHCGSARVRAGLRIWKTVPVSGTAIEPGSAVELAEARLPLDHVHGVPVPLESGPWEARVSLAPGDPVTMNRVRPLPDARSGAPVVLVSGGGGLLVTAEGRLLEDGKIGDRVKVSNLATDQVVFGVLVEPGRVRAGGEG